MKRIVIAITLCVLFAADMAHAKYPPHGPGILGQVTRVGDRYFIMALKNGRGMKVFVSMNTNFQKNGAPGYSSQVKTGAYVRVTGGLMNESTVESWKVNVVDGD